jgi:enoyl-CoA hydratase/carnithine racemase
MSERIRVEVDGPIKTVTLTRPEKRNAMDTAMLDALHDVFTETPAPTDRLLVLRAEGSTYCAGVDLKERLAKGVNSGESPVERVFHAMEHHPLPIVTIVEGSAIAGGCELALHCEFVIASEDAMFGMSLAQIGLAPTWFLAKKLMEVAGPVGTREILLLGNPMPAQWMYDRGLIARVAPKDQLEDEVQKIVGRLSNNAPLSLKAMKAMIVRQLSFRDGVMHEDVDALVQAARQSNDSKEGISAKVEKRYPNFTGT